MRKYEKKRNVSQICKKRQMCGKIRGQTDPIQSRLGRYAKVMQRDAFLKMMIVNRYSRRQMQNINIYLPQGGEMQNIYVYKHLFALRGVGKNILHKHKRLFAGTGGDPEMFKGEMIGKNLNICLFEAIPATALSILSILEFQLMFKLGLFNSLPLLCPPWEIFRV